MTQVLKSNLKQKNKSKNKTVFRKQEDTEIKLS